MFFTVPSGAPLVHVRSSLNADSKPTFSSLRAKLHGSTLLRLLLQREQLVDLHLQMHMALPGTIACRIRTELTPDELSEVLNNAGARMFRPQGFTELLVVARPSTSAS